MGSHQSSETEAFEAGLLDHPDDIARWSAYSDYLSERGDPRGEFMRVQLALEDESLSPADRTKLKAAEAELLAAHEREWLGPLAAFTVDGPKVPQWRSGGVQELPPVFHEFERGWLRRVEFPSLSVNQARALVACTDARLLRELVVEGVAYGDQFDDGPDLPEHADENEVSLSVLLRCPHLRAVRAFRLGEQATFDQEYHPNCHTPGEMSCKLVKALPRVERLELHAHNVDPELFWLPMPRLRHLSVLHAHDYHLDVLADNPTVTELTTLLCHPHAIEHYHTTGAYIRLEHLRAVCRSPHLKKLNHLCLRLTDFGDAGVSELIDSVALARLRVLDLRGGCITDEGARRLAASPHLKGLTFLNLGRNALTEAGVGLIRATGVNADLSNQHTDAVLDLARDIPRYLYEGDYE
jgi:uncharacterized protein (TIGR02996 family)